MLRPTSSRPSASVECCARDHADPRGRLAATARRSAAGACARCGRVCRHYANASTFPEERWRERATPRDTQASFAFERDGRFDGLVSCFIADDPATVFLVAMWVAPDLRGTGAAQQLVESVLEWARGRARRVCLSVEGDNPRAARLYEKCGFAETFEPPPSRTSRTRAAASTCSSSDDGAVERARQRVPRERGALDADRVRAEVGDADGIVEVVARGDDWADVVIWNPDGSTAELSGNATRIVAAWLGAERTTVRVGPREVVARRLPDGRIEQAIGRVNVSAAVAGGRVHRCRRRESARGRGRRSGRAAANRAAARDESALSRADERPGRARRPTGARERARVGARRGGDERVGHERGGGCRCDASGGGDVVVSFPGGDLLVRLEGDRAWLTGPAERVR